MRENAKVYITDDQIQLLIKHFGKDGEPEDLEDYEVGELVDQLIDELV